MDNPFTPKFGYVPPVLAGRDEVLNRIAAGRGSPAHPDSALLLIGRRGTGKTVLLHVAQDEADAQQWVTLFASGAEMGLCDKLAAQAAASVAGDGGRIVGVGAQALGFGATIERAAAPRQPLDSLRFVLKEAAEKAAIRGKGALIAVDELQDADAAEVRELAVAVQYVGSGRRLPIAFVGAGLPDFLAALLADKGMTFFHRCARAAIGVLAPADSQLALAEPVEAAGGRIDDDALGHAVAAASGYPYMVQLIGHHSWEACRDPRRGITADDVVIGEAAANRDVLAQVLLPSWSRLADDERRVLSAMVPPGGTSAAEIARRAQVPEETVVQALPVLAEAGLASAAPDGTADVAHEAMRTWLRTGAGLAPAADTPPPRTPAPRTERPLRAQRGEERPRTPAPRTESASGALGVEHVEHPTPEPHPATGRAGGSDREQDDAQRSRRERIVDALHQSRRASYAQIAEAHTVSRQYVSRIAKEEGLQRDARTRLRKFGA